MLKGLLRDHLRVDRAALSRGVFPDSEAAMTVMIAAGKAHEAHPAYWAPFVVVGEGAAAR